MGTIKTGILGGFNGTVGTVVGSNWKGISTMRARPKDLIADSKMLLKRRSGETKPGRS